MWSDGVRLTAKDVEFGIKRTLEPATASQYAYVITPLIAGASEFNAGRVNDPRSVSVASVGDFALEITLTNPASYFPGIASMWIMLPQPQHVIERYGSRWTEPENIVTRGPFLLESRDYGNSLVLVKNPNYYDARNVAIQKINFSIASYPSTALALYEQGRLDSLYGTGVPVGEIDRILEDSTLSEEVHIASRPCTFFYGFNNAKPPFNNPAIRKAFASAIDRQTLIDSILRGGQQPAQTFTAPGIFGAVDGVREGIGFSFAPKAIRSQPLP